MARFDRPLFGGGRGAAQHCVAVREAPEARDHGLMIAGETGDETVAQRGEMSQRFALIADILAVHQWHERKLPFMLAEPPVPPIL